ncbi:tRNA lysidine(34) synthetase TilS [Rubinisphaera italica]|uniref:tRNA(Ile)-lysidine synthase n=1 Tax=Rubinisphaera italica TaxID=2527969 RepID=A0A5C5XDI8_9PLAN|nr:tRNA lysidine(34) synthetase TilS [Rubinisphaera italica]TWT60373.1 tRNA(Ile)-lysidine synthase [Rubinisphaera italica]
MLEFEKKLLSSISASDIRLGNILLAISGGADSVAMLRAMAAIASKAKISLEVAHFNHQVRPDAASDQDWVGELCSKLRLRFWTNSVKDTDDQPDPVQNDEASLREMRYQFLVETAHSASCQSICVAHHAEDQVETILHHLIRGTGLRGMQGIPENRVMESGIVLRRPLLKFSRQEILDYLQEIGQEYRHDVTNDNQSYTRNRIRQELIPLLQTYNANFSQHLIGLRNQIVEAHAFHLDLVRAALKEAVLSNQADHVRVLVKPICDLPEFLQREFFVELWSRNNWPRQKMTSDDWERIKNMLTQTEGRLKLSAGIIVERRAQMIVIEREN